jgi:hypothetical protein
MMVGKEGHFSSGHLVTIIGVVLLACAIVLLVIGLIVAHA